MKCDHALGFLPSVLDLAAMEPVQNGLWRALTSGQTHQVFRSCNNRQEYEVCNWMVGAKGRLCRSCELTRTRPGDSDVIGMAELADAENAKRRVIMQLLDLGLPGVDPGQLAFDLLSSEHQRVATGHADGIITIDLAESDDARREARHDAGGSHARARSAGDGWGICQHGRAAHGDRAGCGRGSGHRTR